MVIAYEDYPWKNPLRIYWASVTGSRKVSLSHPTLFHQAYDPTLPVEHRVANQLVETTKFSVFSGL